MANRQKKKKTSRVLEFTTIILLGLKKKSGKVSMQFGKHNTINVLIDVYKTDVSVGRYPRRNQLNAYCDFDRLLIG